MSGRITALSYRGRGQRSPRRFRPRSATPCRTSAAGSPAGRCRAGARCRPPPASAAAASDLDTDAAVAGGSLRTRGTGTSCCGCRLTSVDGEVPSHFTIDGYEHIAGLRAGNGVILALPHLGGWEYAAAWMGAQGHRMLAVVEPIEPPELYEWFVAQRDAFGLDIVPLGPSVLSDVLQALRDNRIVCLLSDRDLTGDGVEVEFFGERTTLPGGPATLALRTGRDAAPGRGLLSSWPRPPRRRAAAGSRRTRGPVARRCRPHHAGARRRVRGADPARHPSSGT